MYLRKFGVAGSGLSFGYRYKHRPFDAYGDYDVLDFYHGYDSPKRIFESGYQGEYYRHNSH